MSNYNNQYNMGKEEGDSYALNYGVNSQKHAYAASTMQSSAGTHNPNYSYQNQMISNSGIVTSFTDAPSLYTSIAQKAKPALDQNNTIAFREQHNSHMQQQNNSFTTQPNLNSHNMSIETQHNPRNFTQQEGNLSITTLPQPATQPMLQQQTVTIQHNPGSIQHQTQTGVQGVTIHQRVTQPVLRTEQNPNHYPQLSKDTVQYQMNNPETGETYATRSAQAYATTTPSHATSFNLPASATTPVSTNLPAKGNRFDESPAVKAQQNRILTDCTRKIQENAYYMKQAMDKGELATVLDRASQMVGELCDVSSGSLTPKNYYELYMRALDDMPNLEDYFLSLAGNERIPLTMKKIYGQVQYCPKVLSRLYLQISAGSALIRSKEETAQWVLNDLVEAVKCVQNPLRGLFLRHFLLQATRDKLPDGDAVKHSYDFVLANFTEMNKLWVRIQHLPGDGKTKEQRKRRERERNELRILVGTNLVRLSQLEGVSTKNYGETILPKILAQITACGDPLAQAYLIDCIIQVFPDEYHIETLPILLAVCPKLREKVNIRTIIQSLMDRLSNYYAEEELLDEDDTNEAKKSIAQESFPLFEECVQKVFHARGVKLVSKEVIRLQTALLKFSLKCFPGNMDQVSNCLRVCIQFIRQVANAAGAMSSEDETIKLDDTSVIELQKMLSVPLESLSLKVLQMNQYSELLKILPLDSRRDIGLKMLSAIDNSGDAPSDLKELTELLNILEPIIQGNSIQQESCIKMKHQENNLISKLIYSLESNDIKKTFEMLSVARNHLRRGGATSQHRFALVPVIFVALRIANKLSANSSGGTAKKSVDSLLAKSEIQVEKNDVGKKDEEADSISSHVELESKDEKAGAKSECVASLSIREIFSFIQSTIAMLSTENPELGFKLYLSASLSSDNMIELVDRSSYDFLRQVTIEFLAAAFALYDDEFVDPQTRQRCIIQIVGTLLAIRSLPLDKYEELTTKVTQYGAKLLKKHDQCRMVLLCSYLFFPVIKSDYQKPQRSLECLQRSLKLADASVTSDSGNFSLFVDLLEQYVYFFEKNNPVITEAYVTGLIALIKEHVGSLKHAQGGGSNGIIDGEEHLQQVIEYIKRKTNAEDTSDLFAQIKIE